jgi:hypothetical protein
MAKYERYKLRRRHWHAMINADDWAFVHTNPFSWIYPFVFIDISKTHTGICVHALAILDDFAVYTSTYPLYLFILSLFLQKSYKKTREMSTNVRRKKQIDRG